MAELIFEDLKFEEKEDKIVVTFLDNFYFEVGKEAFNDAKFDSNKVEFAGLSEEEARNKINVILDNGFENLKSKITNKPTIYVNKYFGLPLIGNAGFGITDRNSNMIEIKPVTGCNMNCSFCSVDEGLTSKKTSELVIDKDYLVEETKKLIETKECEMHITINAHGEPTLYKPMPGLIKDLSQIKNVKTVSLITNGTLLTEEYIDKLEKAGLTKLNVSLNAVSEKMAKILEGSGKYDVNHVKRICEYAAKKIEVILAPVFVPGYNDNELGEMIKFAKKIGAKMGVQNFLYYKQGRKPANTEQMPWEQFYEMLKKLEKENDFKLMLDESDFGIKKLKPLPKPFKKDNVVDAVIKCAGRYPNEVIAASDNRNITVTNFKGNNKKVKIKITGDKHNIFYGKAL
ncbi:molybdenum cofactor biosynthesis protein MoaA [Candidatus Woesearchaeota archaeon]|nr:molybdenum cofactor biosynthesis protein MoaA [Candidatus Woesearchaeota archaeon]|tara:strand:+ start:23354 stop:24553 length:1200 start_codon:yes stop_codon:yes gene_type:complete